MAAKSMRSPKHRETLEAFLEVNLKVGACVQELRAKCVAMGFSISAVRTAEKAAGFYTKIIGSPKGSEPRRYVYAKDDRKKANAKDGKLVNLREAAAILNFSTSYTRHLFNTDKLPPRVKSESRMLFREVDILKLAEENQRSKEARKQAWDEAAETRANSAAKKRELIASWDTIFKAAMKNYDRDVLERLICEARNDGMTLQSIADIVGMTREGVRKIECRARPLIGEGL